MRIENLTVLIDKKKIIKNLNLSLKSGEVAALIGPNGAGKSTFLKGICSINVKSQGKVFLKEEDLLSLSTHQRAKMIAYMGQFIKAPSFSVKETLEMGRRPFSGAMLRKKDLLLIDESLEKFNLTKIKDKPLNSLSGGVQQKVMIASAFLQEPKILLLDEPISHLDPKNQFEMMDIIKNETKKSNIITLIVLHDIHHALHYSDSIIALKDGELVGKFQSKEVGAKTLSNLFDTLVSLHEIDGHRFVYYGHRHFNKDSKHHH